MRQNWHCYMSEDDLLHIMTFYINLLILYILSVTGIESKSYCVHKQGWNPGVGEFWGPPSRAADFEGQQYVDD